MNESSFSIWTVSLPGTRRTGAAASVTIKIKYGSKYERTNISSIVLGSIQLKTSPRTMNAIYVTTGFESIIHKHGPKFCQE